MIGYIKGRVTALFKDFCFLETGGKEGRKRKRAPAERKLSAGARLLSPTSLFSISEG